MTLIKSSVSADAQRTENLLESLHIDFVKMLAREIPATTGLTYEEFVQRLADRVFAVDYYNDSVDGYFMHVTRNKLFRREDWSNLLMVFEQEMDEKYVNRFIVDELAQCGVAKVEPEDSDILIEASMDITNGFITTIEQYEEASLDFDSFKEVVDESLTTAYEKISEPVSENV